MMDKHLVAIALLVCVCLGASAVYVWRGGQVAQTGENVQVAENFEVVYEWYSYTGVLYTMAIKDNGTTIENYSRWGENKTTKIEALAENELQEFKNLVIGASVFDFEDNYAAENALPGYSTHYPLTTIKFTIAGETKIVSISGGSGNLPPENLTMITQKIYEFRTLWW